MFFEKRAHFSFYLHPSDSVLEAREKSSSTKADNDGVDARLVERARNGETPAQEALIRRVAPRMLRLARRLGSDPERAEELVEEALYRGLVKLANLRDVRAVGKWFCRILTNLWRDGWPRRGLRTSSLDELPHDPTASERDSPEALVEAGELGENIARAISALPPLQRAVLTLHTEEGFSLMEIAEVLESTPEKVKANLWHARERLRKKLGKFMDPDTEEIRR